MGQSHRKAGSARQSRLPADHCRYPHRFRSLGVKGIMPIGDKELSEILLNPGLYPDRFSDEFYPGGRGQTLDGMNGPVKKSLSFRIPVSCILSLFRLQTYYDTNQ